MLKKLLDIRIILIFILVLAIAALCVFGYLKKQEYDKTIADKQAEISSLEAQLDDIGVLVPVYVLNADVKSGKVVEDTDFDIVNVPQIVADNLVTDLEELRFEMGLVPVYDDIEFEVNTETSEEEPIVEEEEPIIEEEEPIIEGEEPIIEGEEPVDGETEEVVDTEEGAEDISVNPEEDGKSDDLENPEDTEIGDTEETTPVENTAGNGSVKYKKVNNALYYKTDMTAGTVLTRDSVYSAILENDMRLADVALDILPVGIQIGDYVDIRIKFGTGADYVGVAHRQVQAIYGNVLKLILTERDIQMFSSMLVDSIVFDSEIIIQQDKDGDGKIDTETEEDRMPKVGAYLYAIPYVEGGIQQDTKVTYAPSVLVQALMGKNTNINPDDLTPTDLAFYDNFRMAFNADLSQTLLHTEFSEKILTASTIRETIQNRVREAQQIYDRMVEEAEEQARREAEGY